MDAITQTVLEGALKPKTTRQATGELVMTLMQLLHHFNIEDIENISLNYHGRYQRFDVGRLTPDGQHLAEWLFALDANPMSTTFGERLELPDVGPVQ